jgi:hypothetical protein
MNRIYHIIILHCFFGLGIVSLPAQAQDTTANSLLKLEALYKKCVNYDRLYNFTDSNKYSRLFSEAHSQYYKEMSKIQGVLFPYDTFAKKFIVDTLIFSVYIDDKKQSLPHHSFNIYFLITENRRPKLIKAATVDGGFVLPKFASDSCCGWLVWKYNNKLYASEEDWKCLRHSYYGVYFSFKTPAYYGDIESLIDRYPEFKNSEAILVSEYNMFADRGIGYIPIKNISQYFRQNKRLFNQYRRRTNRSQ